MQQITEELAREYQLSLAFLAMSAAAAAQPEASVNALFEKAVAEVPAPEVFTPRLKPLMVTFGADGHTWQEPLMYDPVTSVILGGSLVASKLFDSGYSMDDEDILIETRLPNVGRVDVSLETYGDLHVLKLV